MSDSFKHDPKKISQMYEHLREPSMPDEPHNVIVFGRKDARVAKAFVDLAMKGLAGMAIFTGGIGKDSGDLLSKGYGSEAEWLKEQAMQIGAVPQSIIVETRAKNGGENVRFSLGLMSIYSLERDPVTVVSHATSLRRLAETVRHEAVVAGDPIDAIYRVPTNYDFDPNFHIDAKEAFDEYARLVHWPNRTEGPWLQPQSGLDPNLVDYVRDISSQQ